MIKIVIIYTGRQDSISILFLFLLYPLKSIYRLY